jgi:hypothetical protein
VRTNQLLQVFPEPACGWISLLALTTDATAVEGDQLTQPQALDILAAWTDRARRRTAAGRLPVVHPPAECGLFGGVFGGLGALLGGGRAFALRPGFAARLLQLAPHLGHRRVGGRAAGLRLGAGLRGVHLRGGLDVRSLGVGA